MKKICLLLIGLCLTMLLKAQVSKTVEASAGNLSSLLTLAERSAVTHLTVTGILDARDFKVMRDSMPLLTDVDISEVTIAAYSGMEGTIYSEETIDYPANEVPGNSFLGKEILTRIQLPSTATAIGASSFWSCSALMDIDIPLSVTTIGQMAFMECVKLTTLTLPASVTHIGYDAFSYCSGLTSIYANSSIPVHLKPLYLVFSGINTNSCRLIVPYQSRARYAAATQWKEFKNIEEAASGIALDVSHLEFDAANHNYTFNIQANVQWAVRSNQEWLTYDTPAGNGDQRVTLHVGANPTHYRRTGRITISSDGAIVQTIGITQEGLAKIILLTPGSLKTSMTGQELVGITNLTLEGTIDARDFKVIRDEMLMLTSLDLSRTTVVKYNGTEGPGFPMGSLQSYPANAIPDYAFNDPYKYEINDKFKSIILPLTIRSVGTASFTDCKNLTSMEIPQGVTDIQAGAFSDCSNLTSISLPSSLTKIQTSAFSNCSALQSVSIPSSVNLMGDFTFSGCSGLKEIHAHAVQPLILGEYSQVFDGVDKDSCQLLVPPGSEHLYASASQWRDFKHIIEIPTAAEQLEQDHNSLNCYPNPFTDELAIEIANPSRKDISVAIYSMTGQKIRSLARAQKGAKISLRWNGDDDNGKRAPHGMYLVKMNKIARQVMFVKSKE